MAVSEFSRCIRRDEIGGIPQALTIEATSEECAALAQRFGLIGIKALRAAGRVLLRDGHIIAEGQFDSVVVQSCVVTGDAVRTALSQPFKIRFIDDAAAAAVVEIELSFDEYDDMPLDEDAVDFGEAVAQSLALALPPFPRGPNATRRLREAGVVAEGEEGSGAFARLRDLLK